MMLIPNRDGGRTTPRLPSSYSLLAILVAFLLSAGCRKADKPASEPDNLKVKINQALAEAGKEWEARQKALDEGAEAEEAKPRERVATDPASIRAELTRVGANFGDRKGEPDGPIVRVILSGEKVTNRTLAFVGALPELEELSFDGTAITDRGLAELKSLGKLRKLTVSSGGPFESGSITGKGLQHLAALKGLEHLHLSGAKITDREIASCVRRLPGLRTLFVSRSPLLTSKWLEALEDCKSLTELTLAVMPVGDSGLEALQRVKSLTSLHLCSMPISEAGIGAVGKLRSLRSLDLKHTDVGDRALVRLAGLGDLHELDLSNTKIRGSGLVAMKGMTRLRELNLGETPLDDSGIANLGGSSSLRDLSLDRTQVSDEGIAHLKGLKKLEILGLSYTSVTDAGIAVIDHLGSLKLIRLSGTKVSDQTIKDLVRTRLDLRVIKFD